MVSDPEVWMRRAVEIGLNGYPAPNPHVGCVIVKDGQIIGEGWHEAAGLAHAEIVALQQAGSKARGADVFVTLEPCNHTGRTGPCSEALITAGVRRVFIGVRDPDSRAAGGMDRLLQAGIETQAGVLEEEVKEGNEVFLRAHVLGRPYVCAKAAVTLDGFMARSDGSSKWITGEMAREEGHRLRAKMGAVLVGRKTVQQDDPLLTARLPGVVNQPARIVLDPLARLTGNEQVFNNDAPTYWFVMKQYATGPRHVGCGDNGTFDLSDVLSFLWSENVRGVLVEGGPATLKGFFNSSLVDRFELFVSPTFFESGIALLDNLPHTSILNLVKLSRLGRDIQYSFRS